MPAPPTPPTTKAEIEALLQRQVRAHNMAVVLTLGTVFAIMVAFVIAGPRVFHTSYDHPPWKTFAVMGLLVASILPLVMLVVRYDRYLSHKLGFVCPHCGKPLYLPGGGYVASRSMQMLEDGLCPSCHQNVLPTSPV